MPRPRHPAPPFKLPLFDYEGWAARIVKSVREGQVLADALACVEGFARDVRDTECAREAAGIVGRDTELIRRNCALPVALIARWREDAARDFGPGREFTDHKFVRFLTAMFREVRAAQVAEAVREAGAQAAGAEARQDEQQASKWRRVEANLTAMGQSITGGGFVPVPHP